MQGFLTIFTLNTNVVLLPITITDYVMLNNIKHHDLSNLVTLSYKNDTAEEYRTFKLMVIKA